MYILGKMSKVKEQSYLVLKYTNMFFCINFFKFTKILEHFYLLQAIYSGYQLSKVQEPLPHERGEGYDVLNLIRKNYTKNIKACFFT